MTLALKATGISKDFPVGDESVRVLFDVAVDIRLKELTMLVGPSGCGKTTLISILSGILSASAGDIWVMGKHLTTMRDREKVLLRRHKIGFVFQQFNLLPALTAAENAAIPLVADGMEMAKATARARHILEDLGMKGQTEKLPRQLSGGQQQRIAIARALVHNPSLIICDEPTASLDAKTGKGVIEILRTVANDHQRAVLVVTHDPRIYHFADRILEMSDGRIIGDFLPKEFIHKD
ncbi:MAG: ABC transporter ATP-binding protein [Alphaproteobacteria bacterium]